LASSFLVTALMTPTATIYFMSLTANLPNGGYSEKTSQHIGLVGFIVAIQASPDLTNFGSASSSLPNNIFFNFLVKIYQFFYRF